MELFGIAVFDFGLTPESARDLTFAEFSAMSKQLERREERENQRFANLMSVVVNLALKKKTKPSDFMPKKVAAKPKAESNEERVRRLKQYWQMNVIPAINKTKD